MRTFIIAIAIVLSMAYSASAGCGVGGYGGFNRGFSYGGFNRGFNYGGFNRGFVVNRGFGGFNQGFGFSNRQSLLLQAERLGVASRFEARFLNGLSLSDELELLRRLRLRY